SLMVADAVKHFVHTLIMLWFLQTHLGGLAGFHIWRTTFKAVTAAALTGIAAFGVSVLLPQFLPVDGFNGRLLLVAVSGGAGISVFILAAKFLHLPEAWSLFELFVNKMKRR
ncbi:MAG: hypothetical protein KC419_24440, partial [Anaerolineales bacterium]|nr:hypothetical protein [Anaerolineales bacterium]